MKIIPNSNILIEGKHAAAGKVVETSDAIGKALVVQKLVTVAPATSATPAPVPAAAPKVPVVETAAKPAAPAAETAAAK